MDISQLMFPKFVQESRHKSVLLVGPTKTCKTSFLFQIAVSLSAGSNDPVIFISSQKVDKKPLNVHTMAEVDARRAKNITLVYLKTYADLIKYVANIFVQNESLSGILIDGVDLFLANITENDGTYKECLLRLFALLNDTAAHFTTLNGTTCYAAATCDHKEDNKVEEATFFGLGLHFFDDVLRTEVHNIPYRTVNFLLTDSSDRKFHYYIEDGQIFLDKITEKQCVVKQSLPPDS
ncbi:uncharacterized protein LOC141849011 [Brevipalpus obovatus]|uniref:uncharacterized protein LOC141849011 n=1 Tax=Brevipalpus obovatus TaxID=246614 RepID=UPI003D9E41AA